MSVFSINNIGTKISTQIRQASFDPMGIEANMYFGEEVVSMYAYDIKPSSWAQISWCNLSCINDNNTHTFGIAGREFSIVRSFDYLLAIAIEAIFPQVTLANTPAPVPFTITIGTSKASDLYYHISTGNSGIPAGTIVLGTHPSLMSASSGLGLMGCDVLPFISYSPRHQVSWSQYALLAAIECLTLRVNGVEYESFSRNALFNALQFRTREDVFPAAVEEATSFRATQVSATIGKGAPAVLGPLSEDARYKAFTAPFSFTTSAFADRGEEGKHLSAFPALLCCDASICIETKLVEDLRELLVLQEECMVDYCKHPIVIAVQGSLLTSSSSVVISNGVSNFTISSSSFTSTLNKTRNIMGTDTNVTVTTTPTNTTGCSTCNSAKPISVTRQTQPCNCTRSLICNSGNTNSMTFSPLTLGSFGVCHLAQTGEYLPVTRFSSINPQCSLGREIDYSNWIEDDCINLKLHARALGADVTELERGMSKTDCRNRKFLYEAYTYSCESSVLPGSEKCIRLCNAPGQFKYAYTFAENETSVLQGQYFNFTNSTEFTICADVSLMGTKFIFEGHDSLLYFKQRIDGYDDFHARAKFLTYVDNPLFAQRTPRVTGLHIVPRYANWINSIYPDGSINLDTIKCSELNVKTTPSAQTTLCCCPNFGKSNTVRYNLQTIAVIWRIAFFEIAPL